MTDGYLARQIDKYFTDIHLSRQPLIYKARQTYTGQPAMLIFSNPIITFHPFLSSLINPTLFQSCSGLSQKHFHRWKLPKDIFPRGNFQNVQFPKWQLPTSLLAAAQAPPPSSLFLPQRSGPNYSLWRLKGPNLTFGKLHMWEAATWENDTWELVLGKMILGN